MKVRQEVYDTYWKTATERQEIFFKKLEEQEVSYTNDPIFSKYKFCNVFRASDRVSQFLIRDVIYNRKTDREDTLFRIFLFRLLNRIETWDKLSDKLDGIILKDYDFDKYSKALVEIKSSGPIYGNAFILCANKAFGYDDKHKNHLALLDFVFNKKENINNLLKAKTFNNLFEALKRFPLIGNFMAYQLAIDFNYSEVFDFDENDFTIPGPGAERGIKKCFIDTKGKTGEYIIKYMVENQDKEFERLGLKFRNLFGRKMHAIDCQGWFCETDKYSRIKFPKLKSNRVRMKTSYKPTSKSIKYFYPPKWHINKVVGTRMLKLE